MIESNPITAPQRSWYLNIAILAFVIVAGFSVYFQIAVTRAESKIEALQAQKLELEKPLAANVAKSNAVSAAVAIKSALQKIDAGQVRWAKLVEKINGTIPKEAGTQKPVVVFRSYNGDADGTISVNATTLSGSVDPFADAAATIRAFSTDPAFQHVFVPTLVKSTGNDGASVLNFTMNFLYQQPKF